MLRKCKQFNKCRCKDLHNRPEYILYDARGISCGYVCEECEDTVKAQYRPDIFTDGHYECDEPIEENY